LKIDKERPTLVYEGDNTSLRLDLKTNELSIKKKN
jgi:hypothetical protein